MSSLPVQAASRLLVAFLTLTLAHHASSAATNTYYVDCAAGSDSAAGTAPLAAWRTIAKVSATRRCGATWEHHIPFVARST